MYLYWGYLLSSVVLVIVLATSARAVFIVYFKYDQAKGVNFEEVDIDQRKLQT